MRMNYLALCCLALVLGACGDKGKSTPSSSAATIASSSTNTVSSVSSATSSSSVISSSSLPASSISSAVTSNSLANSSSSLSSSSQSSASSDLYSDYVEPLVVQARCANCHVSSGQSGGTRLVFNFGDGQAQHNRQVFSDFVATVTGGDELILNKIRGGENHGGGAIYALGTPQYQAVAEFLSELNGGVIVNPSEATGFNKLTLGDQQQTLRRALLLLAGRVPTDDELAAINSDNSALRSLLLQAMAEPGFHEFLTRSANDRLLTEAFNNGRFLEVMDPVTPRYPLLANMRVEAYSGDQASQTSFNRWQQKLIYGVSRAPLELIAYVVENDRPYSEILTADYIMVNPYSAQIYNAEVQFNDPTNVNEFVPGQNRGQILADSNLQAEYVQELGSVITAHGDFIDYPHAGILNDPAFLNRYPTTDTNRNRARSRWTYYHFLDVDIEKSAARTNDPAALADTNNPTMNNPNCTVCHQVMDPIAGTYQNYGNEGWFLSSWGGLDSLPDAYKWTQDSPYVPGDTWFRDMRTPGFNGATVPNAKTSLQWLAQQIGQDDRFARAAVKFWWPAIMSEPLRYAPESSGDPFYQAQLLAFEYQESLIDQLATDFQQNNLNLKSLLVDMVMSTWFRASGTSAALTADEAVELQGVGSARLLTPEELEAKTRSLFGFVWGETTSAEWVADGHWSMLQDNLRIYYGGIDSMGITERAEAHNSLMANVALSHALGIACPSVLLDFNQAPPQQRLFKYVDRYTTPTLQARAQVEVTGTDEQTRSDYQTVLDLKAGNQTLRFGFDNPYWDASLQQSLNLVIHSVLVQDSNGNTLLQFAGQNLLQVPGAVQSTNENGDFTSTAFWDSSIPALTGWQMWAGYIEVPLTLAQDTQVSITVNASKRNLLDRQAFMSVSAQVELGQNSYGEQQLRRQLQYLHGHLLGEWLELDASEITASYDLLVDLWTLRQNRGFPRNAIAWDIESCEIPIEGWWQQDRSAEFADPNFMQGTWMSIMVYLLTDYKYLHE